MDQHAANYAMLRANGVLVVYCPDHSPRLGQGLRDSYVCKKRRDEIEREAGANHYADLTMRALGISIPRKVAASNAAYVQRKKRHGDRIRAARGGR